LDLQDQPREVIKKVTAGGCVGMPRVWERQQPFRQCVALVFPLESRKTAISNLLAGHEVVEVNGFTFKRRRRANAPPAAPAAAPLQQQQQQKQQQKQKQQQQQQNRQPNATNTSQPLKTPSSQVVRGVGGVFADPALPQADPSVDNYTVSRELYLRLGAALRALPPAGHPGERLQAIAASVAGAELDTAYAECDDATSSAVADVLATFLELLRDAWRGGELRFGPHRPAHAQGGFGAAGLDDGAEQEGEAYEVDLEARKAGLRARLSRFEKVCGGGRR
jgi:hypothetical protein